VSQSIVFLDVIFRRSVIWREGVKGGQQVVGNKGILVLEYPSVIPDVLVEQVVLPGPGDVCRIVVIVRHRPIAGNRRPQAGKGEPFDRPEKDESTFINKADRILGSLEEQFRIEAEGTCLVSLKLHKSELDHSASGTSVP